MIVYGVLEGNFRISVYGQEPSFVGNIPLAEPPAIRVGRVQGRQDLGRTGD